MILKEVIANSYKQIIATEGVEVYNKTLGKSFVGLVSSGDLSALFTVADQDLTDSLQITTLAENTPKTGNKISVADKVYTVKQVTTRVNSPIIKILLER